MALRAAGHRSAARRASPPSTPTTASPRRAVEIDGAAVRCPTRAREHHRPVHRELDAPGRLLDEHAAGEIEPAEAVVEGQQMLAADQQRELHAMLVVERRGRESNARGRVAAAFDAWVGLHAADTAD